MALEDIAVGPLVRGSGGTPVGLADAQPRSGSALVAAALEQPIQTAELNIGIQMVGHGRRHHQWRDRDRDGIPDHRDRDRDNDGIPNRWDPNPNRPNYPYYPIPPYYHFDRPCRPYERPDFFNIYGQPRCYGPR